MMFRRFERVGQDLGYGWRMLRRSPVFTLVAVLSLGLGIGVNTAIFGVIYAVLLEGLPLPAADQLVALRGARNNVFAYEEFRALRGANAQTQLSAFASAGLVRLAYADQRDFISIEQVDGSFFTVLGLRPLRGRLITPDDDAAGAAVVVISETMWERYFQRRADALGKTITLNDAPFAVVGITSARYQGLYFPGSFQMAVPLKSSALLNTGRTNTSGPALTVIGRLGKPPSSKAKPRSMLRIRPAAPLASCRAHRNRSRGTATSSSRT